MAKQVIRWAAEDGTEFSNSRDADLHTTGKLFHAYYNLNPIQGDPDNLGTITAVEFRAWLKGHGRALYTFMKHRYDKAT